MARRILPEGEQLIQKFEGCRLESYVCSGGRWTVGWGETGPDIRKGTVWTQEQADARFQARLRKIEGEVEMMLKGQRIPDSVFSALVCLAYNIGTDALSKSTLMRKLRKADFLGAWAEYPRWVHAAGTMLPGLIRRRKAEQDLWNLYLASRGRK